MVFEPADGLGRLPIWVVGGSFGPLHIKGRDQLEASMTNHTLFAPLQDLSGALVGLVAAAAPAIVSVSLFILIDHVRADLFGAQASSSQPMRR